MSHLGSGNQQVAVAVAGQAEPIEPAYTKPNYSNAINSPYPIPSEAVTWQAPIVNRGQDTRGMRYLWADMRQRQPISPLGTGPDIGTAVWSSEFQPDLGSLRDYGFYDLLYRAGYPGFNLGLSFRVPVNPSVGGSGPGANINMKAPPTNLVINVMRRATGRANPTG